MAAPPAVVTYPWYLKEGTVAIYGVGFNTPPSFRTIAQNNIVYGIVNQVWDGGNIQAQVGDRVYWKQGDDICQLAYDNYPYTILEQNKIIITEKIVILP